MNEAELCEAHEGYWGEHINYPLVDWHHDVINNATRLGYWAWVADRIEHKESENGNGEAT